MVLPLLVNSLFGRGIFSHPYDYVLKTILTTVVFTRRPSYEYQPALCAIPRFTNLNNRCLVCVSYVQLAKESFYLLKHHVSPIVYTVVLPSCFASSFYTLHSLTPLLLLPVAAKA
jgi:hypothetical protein